MEYSLSYILSKFLEAIAQDKRMEEQPPFLSSIIGIYRCINFHEVLPHSVRVFSLDDIAANNAIESLKKTLKEQDVADMNRLNSPVSYLLDELICNVQ